MTLNCYFALNSVFAPFGWLWLCDFRKIIALKVIKIDTYCQQRKSSAGSLLSDNIRFVRIFARVLSKEIQRRRQGTVGSRVNAGLDLILAFEKNCIQESLADAKVSARQYRVARYPVFYGSSRISALISASRNEATRETKSPVFKLGPLTSLPVTNITCIAWTTGYFGSHLWQQVTTTSTLHTVWCNHTAM